MTSLFPSEPHLSTASPLKQRIYAPSPPTSSVYSGELQIILGPMFSGKTTELLRRVRRYEIAGKRCCVIKYAMDNRYDNECASTHDRVQLPAISACELAQIPVEAYQNLDVLAIDEGQFFPDVADFCERRANEGKIVLVAALDATFERKAFGPILSLIPIAEQVVKLNAVCMACGRDASFSKRIGNERRIEVIGGAEKYWSTCRRCFHSTQLETPEIKRKRRAASMEAEKIALQSEKRGKFAEKLTNFEKPETVQEA